MTYDPDRFDWSESARLQAEIEILHSGVLIAQELHELTMDSDLTPIGEDTLMSATWVSSAATPTHELLAMLVWGSTENAENARRELQERLTAYMEPMVAERARDIVAEHEARAEALMEAHAESEGA